MKVELNDKQIDVILESLKYSKQRVSDSSITPYDLKQEKLKEIDEVVKRLKNKI